MSKKELANKLLHDFANELREVSDDRDAFLTLLIGVYAVVKRELHFLPLVDKDGVEADAKTVADILIERREELQRLRDSVNDASLAKVIRAMARAVAEQGKAK